MLLSWPGLGTEAKFEIEGEMRTHYKLRGRKGFFSRREESRGEIP